MYNEENLRKAYGIDIEPKSTKMIQSLPEGASVVDIDAVIRYDTIEFMEDYTTNGWASRDVKVKRVVRSGENYILTFARKAETFNVAIKFNGLNLIADDWSSIPLLH